jgi:para-aminobenzoate synthetase component 1
LENLPDWALEMNRLGSARIPFLFLIDFDFIHPVILPLSEISSECIRFEINPQHAVESKAKKRKSDFSLIKSPVSFSEYQRGFDQVQKAIHAGDTYLLNLCYTTHVTGIDSLESVFHRVSAPYKLLFQNRFVVFSPEQFVSIRDGLIRTFPMKGTLDAALPDAESILINDVKEQEEHATVVDLLRNDLSIVAGNVTVDRYRFISRIVTAGKTLLQCSSEISGRLGENSHDRLGSIFNAILPAGSITGAPKKKTVELIKSIEAEPRGYYTGVFGVFDGASVDSAVMIRMIEQRGDQYYYRSGGGITYRSDARQEYQEMIDKVYIPLG